MKNLTWPSGTPYDEKANAAAHFHRRLTASLSEGKTVRMSHAKAAMRGCPKWWSGGRCTHDEWDPSHAMTVLRGTKVWDHPLGLVIDDEKTVVLAAYEVRGGDASALSLWATEHGLWWQLVPQAYSEYQHPHAFVILIRGVLPR